METHVPELSLVKLTSTTWVLLIVTSDSSKLLWTVARQTPLSVVFSRQVYWSGLSFPPPGDLRTYISCVSCIERQILDHQHHLGNRHLSGKTLKLIPKRRWSDYFSCLSSFSLCPSFYITQDCSESDLSSYFLSWRLCVSHGRHIVAHRLLDKRITFLQWIFTPPSNVW